MAEMDYFSLVATGGIGKASEPQTDFFSMAAGVGSTAKQAPHPLAEPDAPTWIGRRIQDVRGKQDPRYADVPAYTGSHAARYGAGLLTHDDAAYGDIVKKSLGNRHVQTFKDANGYDIMDYKGEGVDADKTFRAYVNKPGLDRFDVSRGITSAIPFVATGGATAAATAGRGLATRALTQGGAAAATSMQQDILASAAGSEQGVDGGRAALFGALGAGGEVAGYLVKPLIDRWRASGMVKNGALTAEGEAAAKAAGLDPAQVKGALAQEFKNTYAKTGDASAAALSVKKGEFGIPTTVGQREKLPDLLTKEEGMRRNLYGEPAQKTIREFDVAQATAIDNAARGGVRQGFEPGVQELYGVAPTLAPQRALRPGKDELGGFIQEGLAGAKETAKAGEREAWKQPIDMMAKKEALAALPEIIDGKLGSMTIDSKLMPASGGMVDQLKAYIAGDLEKLSVGAFGTNPRMATVDEMRKRLGGMLGNASTEADRTAAKQIYHGFNDWIEHAAEKSLLAGDAQAAANLRKAIDVTREYRGLFNPRDASGKEGPAAKILRDVMGSESTPERIIQRMFGGQPLKSQAPPPGTVDALRSMKQIFQKYGPDPRMSVNPWDDVRLAYWTRLVQDNKGEMLTPGNLVNNIKGAFASQSSVLRELYTSQEIQMMKRFMAEVEKASYKPPNASGSGYGVAHFAKEAITTVGKSLSAATGGWADKIIFALLRPVANEYGRAAASRATAQEMGRRVPMAAAAYGAAAGSALDQ